MLNPNDPRPETGDALDNNVGTSSYRDPALEDGHDTIIRVNERPRDDSSLIDDVTALYEDGKDYLSAEVTFQKSRARFVGNRAGKIAGLGAGAAAIAYVALIALAVGLILTLMTLMGPLLATLIVVAVFLVIAGILGAMMLKEVRQLQAAMGKDKA